MSVFILGHTKRLESSSSGPGMGKGMKNIEYFSRKPCGTIGLNSTEETSPIKVWFESGTGRISTLNLEFELFKVVSN